jgi:hypothetical protein
MYCFLKKINIEGLRYPKIFTFNNNIYLIGSKQYDNKGGIKKYACYLINLDVNFNIIGKGYFIEIGELNYLTNFNQSSWIRDINIKNNKILFNIEIKNNINNSFFENENYIIETEDLINFKIIKKYNINQFIFKELILLDNKIILSSNIIKSSEHFWGKYLFNFFINDIQFTPQFDKFIDYKSNMGHLVHSIKKHNEIYTMLFSIRHKGSDHYYKIYKANTENFKTFYDTREVHFSDYNNSQWFSYPDNFNFKGKDYIICNTDDFGKNSKPIIFQNLDIEEFVKKKYNIQTYLQFSVNKKYIFYEEIKNKNGKRYNTIKEDIHNYSSYSPCCHKIYDLIKKLNINETNSIIDIGSGRGLALSIFGLFPFKKITGVEINESEYRICLNNLNNLNLNNISVLNLNILDYKNLGDYNYVFLYNPFGIETLEKIIMKLPRETTLIFKNIHNDEIKMLNNFGFILDFEFDGEVRNYKIFKNIIL